MQELLSKATEEFHAGRFETAKERLLELLKKDPKNIAAKEILAYILAATNEQNRALDLLKEVVADPQAPISALYEYASLKLESAPDEAIPLLERAFQIQPRSFEVLHDLATAYALVGRRKEAIEKYATAATLGKNSCELFYNLGCLHDESLNLEKANACYRESIAINPRFTPALINLGLNLNQTRNFKEGLQYLNQAYFLEPTTDFLFGHILHTEAHLGLWKDQKSQVKKLIEGVKLNKRVVHPLIFLGLVDDPELQQKVSKIYSQSRPQCTPENFQASSERNNKIRVGYFSSDFHNHPVTHLTAQLFELHNRDKFEIYGFSSGIASQDEQRLRVMNAFDEFIDISSISDEEAVKLARSKGIDIAVDLGGYTHNSRIGIFERRAAPIQISYLGYLGTLGSAHMDYILADHEVIPKECERFFNEKIIFLPECYQITDRKRVISTTPYTRAQFGLPREGFIFCNFNSSYKITPEVFASWCQIMRRVEGSVLWLFESSQDVMQNLRHEALMRGVNENRLLFSGVLPMSEYLARYKLADLFLDTFPYNAGTTASDALWAGLPVLTRSGKSFPSRMAGSLLKALEVPELVTYSTAAYEEVAVDLATDEVKLAMIQNKVRTNRDLTALFDSTKTTKNIERAYQEIHKRYLEGKLPENIDLI